MVVFKRGSTRLTSGGCGIDCPVGGLGVGLGRLCRAWLGPIELGGGYTRDQGKNEARGGAWDRNPKPGYESCPTSERGT